MEHATKIGKNKVSLIGIGEKGVITMTDKRNSNSLNRLSKNVGLRLIEPMNHNTHNQLKY